MRVKTCCDGRHTIMIAENEDDDTFLRRLSEMLGGRKVYREEEFTLGLGTPGDEYATYTFTWLDDPTVEEPTESETGCESAVGVETDER